VGASDTDGTDEDVGTNDGTELADGTREEEGPELGAMNPGESVDDG